MIKMKNLEIIVILRSPDYKISEFTSYLSVHNSFSQFITSLRPFFFQIDETHTYSDQIIETISEMRRYLFGFAPPDKAQNILYEINKMEQVESAYIKPPTENPIAPFDEKDQVQLLVNENIPDLSVMQGYLQQVPGGVNARFAWSFDGGRGADVNIVDIEGDWQLTHIDLRKNNGGLIGGTPYGDVKWRDHGTAVLAEIGGDENIYGVTGISPDAMVNVISHNGLGSANAIKLAADKLKCGDIILLEMHRPGPRYNYQCRDDQLGYLCVEWWPCDLLAIKYATLKGIIVVEAAGNGGENLDDPFYNTPNPNFPASWKNPLTNPTASGAIMVGAGAPPNELYGKDRSRLRFSNYGSCIDCQGWGRSVVTAGFGNLFRNPEIPQDENYWYTGNFSGTSSASPIVTGVIACLQGIAKRRGSTLTNMQIRNALRTTGSPQIPDSTEQIGSRPDLRQLIEILF